MYKRDGLKKMKVEKMGEKKEEFLKKLGECYSISTKNETLPNKGYFNWREEVLYGIFSNY
jgi:hypothetical protein